MKTKSPEAPKLSKSEAVERDHELALMVEQAFGDDWKKLTAEKQRRVLEATPESNPKLYAAIQKAVEKGSGKVDYTPATPVEAEANDEPEIAFEDEVAPQRAGGMIRNLARKAAGLGRKTKTGAKNFYWATTKPFTAANYAYSKFVAHRLDESQKWSDTYNNMSPAERREHHKKVAWRGNLAVLGGAALMLVLKNKGIMFADQGAPQSVSGGVNPDQAPAAPGAGVQPEDAPTAIQPGLVSGEHAIRDPQGSTDLRENRVRTIDDYPTLEAYGRHQELNWLNANNRQGNDFNNITPEELNDPANKDHFPGYTALKEQFEKSPNELAAQLRQIQVIEASKGLKLDFIPEEFRGLLLQPGESQEGYIARLGAALHENNDLHKLLGDGALKYIEANAQPLRDLTENYGANYIVLVNGVPTVGFDEFVQSASKEDTVLMLSDTMGIRFPCGQCIELMPQKAVGTPVEQPSYSAPVVTERPVQATPQRPTTPGGTTPGGGGNTPGGGGGNPGNPGNPGGGGENPNPQDEEHKIWDGHPADADGQGIVDHIEDTEDFATRGNGTGSANAGNQTPQSEAGTRADGAAANTDPQVGQQEAGAGENRTESDAEARREAQKAEREQKQANDRAEKAEKDAQDAKKQDDAVKAAQNKMGADGRPDKGQASGASGSGSGSGGESGGSSSSGGSE